MAFEQFVFGACVWDVEKAIGIVADGRNTIDISMNDCLSVIGAPSRFVTECGERRFGPKHTEDGCIEPGRYIDGDHVMSVDPAQPGILAVLFDSLTIIDGHHRAVRRWLMGYDSMPFYELTTEESDSCLVEGRESLQLSRKIHYGIE